MPVTEIALLRLRPGVEATSRALRTKLAKAKAVLERASGFEFWYYHCVEALDLIFILGAWSSVDFHMNDFIPGQPNQELLALLDDQMTGEWMFHLDIDQTKTPLPLGKNKLAISRHFIKEGERQQFQDIFENHKHELGSHVGLHDHVVGGWRLDKGWDPKSLGGSLIEFVLLMAWDSVEDQFDFAKTDEIQGSQIRNHVDGVDIKYAVRLEVNKQ